MSGTWFGREGRPSGTWFVLALPLAVLAAAGLGAARGDAPGEPPAALAAEPDIERGQTLFERHCAVCHGQEGRGDGQAAYLLEPAPRNFASGRFRLISTRNGMPTQADLIASIRRGMPGSAMPPWEWLSEEDLWSLALFVRHLAIEGQIADLLVWAAEEGDELSAEEARSIVEGQMVPGEGIEVGAPPMPDPVTLHEGQRLYLAMCAACHGADGTGSKAGDLRNEDGSPNKARDFTAGVFKGGADHVDIVRRIVGGLPGSSMPSTELEDPHQAEVLAAYVRSLIKPGAQERVVQRRRSVRVARVQGSLPSDPLDPAWERTEGVWVALMPLWWRDDRVEGVVVRALHDGQGLAFKLSWLDPEHDDDILGPTSFSDSAAIEISVERDPPLFAMGAVDHPVDIAMWRAAWEADAVAARDVRDRWPAMENDPFLGAAGELADLMLTAREAGNSMSVAARPGGAEALMAQGFGTVGPRGARSSWTARGTWTGGYWDVVFTRAMSAELEGEPALSPGLSAFLAFAVWDGAFGDRNGQKSVSVWHRLEVAP